MAHCQADEFSAALARITPQATVKAFWRREQEASRCGHRGLFTGALMRPKVHACCRGRLADRPPGRKKSGQPAKLDPWWESTAGKQRCHRLHACMLGSCQPEKQAASHKAHHSYIWTQSARPATGPSEHPGSGRSPGLARRAAGSFTGASVRALHSEKTTAGR